MKQFVLALIGLGLLSGLFALSLLLFRAGASPAGIGPAAVAAGYLAAAAVLAVSLALSLRAVAVSRRVSFLPGLSLLLAAAGLAVLAGMVWLGALYPGGN
ncbi:MAG TPA: hypothetical protein PLI51_03620 [bacterium]|nr:hypothetical protein [bacterium]HPQ65803.1 hypothetical protein [bacterium]